MIEHLHRYFPELNEWRSAVMKWSVSWRIWAFWFLGAWLGSSAIESGSHPESISLVSALAASLLGQLAGGAVIWLAAATWLRNRLTRPVSVGRLLATWFASGAATYVATDLMLKVTSSSYEIDEFATLITFSSSVMLRWFVSVAVLAGFEVLRSRRLEARQALETEQDLLQGLHTYADAIDVEQRSFIRTILEPRINSLRMEIDSLLFTGSSSPESFAQVQDIATDASNKARALSHTIASMDWSPVRLATPVLPPRRASDWAAEFFGYLPRVLPVTLWLVAAQVAWTWSNTGLQSTTVVIFFQTVLIVGLLAFGHLVRRLLHSASLSLHQALTHALFAIAVIATWKLDWAVATMFNEPNPKMFAALWTVRTGCLIIGTSLLCFIISMNKQVTSELTTRRQHIRALRFESEQLVAAARERYAVLLHGPIQGRLALASLLIAELSPTNPSTRPISEAQKVRLTQLLDSVHDELTSPTFNNPDDESLLEFLDKTRQLWSGLVDLDWSVTDEALTRISTYPRATRNLIQLCDEAINNAKKHGRARRIRIVIDFPDEFTNVVVRILNDGVSPAPTLGSGLGNHMYSSLTLDWSLRSIEPADSSFTTELKLTVIAAPQAQQTGFSRPSPRASRASADLVTSGV
jgi:hypothetical protein